MSIFLPWFHHVSHKGARGLPLYHFLLPLFSGNIMEGHRSQLLPEQGESEFQPKPKLCVHAQTNGKRKHFVLIFRPDQKKFVRRVVPLSQLSENILLHKIIFSLIMNQNSRNCYLQFV